MSDESSEWFPLSTTSRLKQLYELLDSRLPLRLKSWDPIGEMKRCAPGLVVLSTSDEVAHNQVCNELVRLPFDPSMPPALGGYTLQWQIRELDKVDSPNISTSLASTLRTRSNISERN